MTYITMSQPLTTSDTFKILMIEISVCTLDLTIEEIVDIYLFIYFNLNVFQVHFQ